MGLHFDAAGNVESMSGGFVATPRGLVTQPSVLGPEAQQACAEVISVPVRSSLAPETVRQIAGVIRRVLEG